uniref:Uncharacterized protein n=1 Tax=viral metagenome TaxID=1070528 RepID=A0A6C0KR39_9ZZZZ
MRKSRKNKYYSQNQEGGGSWLWRKHNSVAPEPIQAPNRDSIKVPWYQSLYHTPYVNPFGSLSPGSSYGQNDGQNDGYMPNTAVITLTKEDIKKRHEEKIEQTINDTIQNIISERGNIRTLLQTEDEDVLKYLQTSVEYNYDYAGNINPLTSYDNIQDKQTYLNELKEELKKTVLYHSMLKKFGGEYRVKKVIDNGYKEPNSLYKEEILSNKAKIISIRTEIKELLPLLKGNIISMNRQDFDRVLNLRKEYNGVLLPRTVPQAIFYKEFELSELREELIRTQNDLEELKRLIESPIQPPPPE